MLKVNNSAPVLVTGGGGYLASWLVKQLLDEGLVVRITVRDLADSNKVAHLHALAERSTGSLEVYAADLLLPGSFDLAMKGCRVVFHTASPFMLANVSDPERQLVEPALVGTENVLSSVNRCESVERVVLTSSVVAIMGDNCDINRTSGGQFDESYWNESSTAAHQPYSYAKTQAEKAAWRLVKAQKRWNLVVINPGFILGPSLSKWQQSFSINTMLSMANGEYKYGLPQLYNGVVDVRDAARAHFMAAFTPSASGRHIVVNQTFSLLELSNILSDLFPNQFNFAQWEVPKWLLWLIAPLIGRSRRFVSDNFNVEVSFDNTRSISKLGMVYLPIETTLGDHLQQIIDDGLIEPAGVVQTRAV